MKVLSPQGDNLGEFNVLAYGAKGDNSTNDTAAIQAAIDAASTWATSNGGRAVVRIPHGRYRCNSTLIVKSGITVIAYGAYIYSGNNNYLCSTYISQAADYTTGFSNIKFLGGIWDAKGQNTTTQTYNIFTLGSGTNITFRDVTMRNVPSYHAIDINSCSDVLIDGCRFEGFQDNGSREWSEAIQLQEFSTSGCQNITVTNCYMGPSAASDGGLNAHGKFIGSHTNTSNTQHRRILISNNIIDQATDIGIGTQCWSQVQITNNIFRETALESIRIYSISVGAVTDINISGNTFTAYQTTAGINFAGNPSADTDTFRNCVIANNTFATSSATAGVVAIYAKNLEDSVISGNVIKDGPATGIYLQTCNDVLVTGNSIQDVDGAGIRIASGERNQVTGNRLYFIGEQGVYLSDNTIKNMISDNSIIAAGKALDATYGCIHLGNSAISETTITGNKFHKHSGTPQALNPIVFAGSSPTLTFISSDNDFGDDWSSTWRNNITLNGATYTGDQRTTSFPVSFHLTGSLTTGVKTPEFIAPVACEVVSLYARVGSGSGSAVRPSKNGGSSDGTIRSSIGTSSVNNTQSVTLAAGDRLGLNVTTASTGADLSVTMWVNIS